jgi:tetratricopeptide (TPR) repeat protein
MVRRHYRCQGLDPEATLKRLEQVLRREGGPDPEEAAALAALIAPDDQGGAKAGRVAVRFGSARERHMVVGRMLERACRERPVVVWLDDVQWGSDALDFARFIVEPLIPLPILIVATVRPEALADHQDAAVRVENLLQLPLASALPVGVARPASGLCGDAAQAQGPWVCGPARSPSRAAQSAEDFVEDARRHRWRSLLGWALRERAQALAMAAEGELAQACLEEALALARELGDRFLLANCTRELGALHLDRGAWFEAIQCLVRARDAFVLAGDWTRLGVTHVGLSELSKRQGLLFEAAEDLHAARRCFEKSGFRFGVAECINHLGDVVRLQGELEWAGGLYAESRDRFLTLGAPNAAVPTTNLGLVQLEQGHMDEARVTLEIGLQELRNQGRLHLAASVHACLLPCVAHAADWTEFAYHLAQARALFERTGAVEVDAARFAALGGDHARLGGQLALGRDALALSQALWLKLGRQAEARRVGARLARA